jgi:3-hydroxyacyl-CoA dehydrogenase
MIIKDIQKGKLSQSDGGNTIEKVMYLLHPYTTLNELKDCEMIIEAVTQNNLKIDINLDLCKHLVISHVSNIKSY